MRELFEFLFFFGVSFVVLSVVLGQLGYSSCCYTATGVFGLTYMFQPLPVLLFVMFTGGAGMMLGDHFQVVSSLWLLLPLSVTVSLGLTYPLMRWVFVPLFHLERTSSTTFMDAYGHSFILQRSVSHGQTVMHPLMVGDTYQNRLIATEPDEPATLTKGTVVQIVSIQDPILYVRRKPS